jgi:predicted DNA-binding protein (MmcQ/YjbR family)
MNIEDLQALCKSLPAATETIKWGNEMVYSVGGKMFCVAGLDQSPTTASFKVTDEEFDDMSSREGFKPAPYVAKYKWVWMDDLSRMNKKEWQHYVTQSYELVKAKLSPKVKREAGII